MPFSRRLVLPGGRGADGRRPRGGPASPWLSERPPPEPRRQRLGSPLSAVRCDFRTPPDRCLLLSGGTELEGVGILESCDRGGCASYIKAVFAAILSQYTGRSTRFDCSWFPSPVAWVRRNHVLATLDACSASRCPRRPDFAPHPVRLLRTGFRRRDSNSERC